MLEAVSVLLLDLMITERLAGPAACTAACLGLERSQCAGRLQSYRHDQPSRG
jgi:hypothetical protein